MVYKLFFAQVAFLIAKALLLGAAIVDVAFLRLSGYSAATRATGHETGKGEDVFFGLLGFATLRQNPLHLVKQFLRHERLMSTLINFAIEPHQPNVEGILEQPLDVAVGQWFTQITDQTVVLAPIGQRMKRLAVSGVQLEEPNNVWRLLSINIDLPRSRIVQVTNSRPAGPLTAAELLSETTFNVLAKVIDEILALAEGDVEHKQALRRWLKPKGWKF